MITPKRPAGFHELLPKEQMVLDAMIQKIKGAYEHYGYAPLETPALELAEVLLAKEGGETAKQVYRFKKGDNDLALRFDLTVPLARYVAEHYHELAFPFRRYQIQEVWRAEKPQAGRFRQFYQCDIDTLGSASPAADADILLAARAALNGLKLETEFKISHRGLLTGWLAQKKLDKKTTAVLRAIDKLEKLGERAVADELKKAGLKQSVAKEIFNLVRIKGAPETVLKKLRSLKITKPVFIKAIEDLNLIAQLLTAGGFKNSEFSFDLSIARGLDYYTGMVFETYLAKNKSVGSICSGGRYDNLVGHYRKDALAGVGASIGLSRLFSALRNKLESGPSNPAQVLIVSLSAEVANYSLKVAETLRHSGLNILVYPGVERAGKQFSYADKLGIPMAIVCGENEMKKKTVTIKNMKSGKQTEVSLSKAANSIKKVL